MQKHNRFLFAIFTLTVIIAGISFQLRDTHPTIPPYDEARFFMFGDRGLKRVDIIKEDLGQLRQIIEVTKRDRFPMKWAVLGTLELKANGTTISTIQMFSNPNGTGPLEISDSYYLGYDQVSFLKILDRAIPIDIP
jgi:hypothetical protein